MDDKIRILSPFFGVHQEKRAKIQKKSRKRQKKTGVLFKKTFCNSFTKYNPGFGSLREKTSAIVMVLAKWNNKNNTIVT